MTIYSLKGTLLKRVGTKQLYIENITVNKHLDEIGIFNIDLNVLTEQPSYALVIFFLK